MTFELLESVTPVAVDDHEQLVLYLAGPTQRDELADRLEEAGLMPCTQYRYWDDNDAVTFRDPDGREIVFAPWVLGNVVHSRPPRRAAAELEPAVGLRCGSGPAPGLGW